MTADTPQSLRSNKSSIGGNPNVKAYACLPCRERKIKCDRINPCSHCVKSNRQCSFVAPVRGKRKPTKPPRENLHDRLKRYEGLLRSVGVNVENSTQQDDSESLALSPNSTVLSNDVESVRNQIDLYKLEETNPKLITKEGTSRYFDSALWVNVGDEFRHPEIHSQSDSTEESDDNEEELFLGHDFTRSLAHLADLHPTAELLDQLKLIYTERVDPLVKVLHLPTFWSTLKEAHLNLHDAPKSLQALMFAFYLITVASLMEDECQMLFGLQRSVVLARYRIATRRALTNASFLSTSSPTTLSAYALYLIGVRNHYKGDTLYILSGIAVRLARKMGLHRDGTSLGLMPFDTEMRRRLWWHIVTVDYHTADIQGTRPSMDLSSGDTKLPLNVEDDDLHPDMIFPPAERNAILPVTISLVKCEITETIRKFSLESQSSLRFEVLSSSEVSIERKETIINDLENHFEQRYLRYHDPSNGLHTFTSIMIRSSICKMRLFAYRPELSTKPNAAAKPSNPEHREKAFANAIKLLEYILFMHGDHTGAKKFTWQIGPSYLLITMLYVLIEVKYRKTGPEVDKAWQLIGEIFCIYPTIFQDSFKSAFTALIKWTLDVWDVYVAESMAQNLGQPSTPGFIITLRQRQKAASKTQPPIQPVSAPSNAKAPTLFRYGTSDSVMNGQQNYDLASFESYEFSSLQSMELDSNDWSQWEHLFAEPSTFQL